MRCNNRPAAAGAEVSSTHHVQRLICFPHESPRRNGLIQRSAVRILQQHPRLDDRLLGGRARNDSGYGVKTHEDHHINHISAEVNVVITTTVSHPNTQAARICTWPGPNTYLRCFMSISSWRINVDSSDSR